MKDKPIVLIHSGNTKGYGLNEEYGFKIINAGSFHKGDFIILDMK
jgi:hypothetical protein